MNDPFRPNENDVIDRNRSDGPTLREQQSGAEIPEGSVHALDLPENLDGVAGLELLLQPGDDLADVVGHALQPPTITATLTLKSE